MSESYVPIPDASLAIGKPVTSTIAKQLRTNPIAIAQGHSLAERIWAQALRYTDFAVTGDWAVPQGVRCVYVEVIGGGAAAGTTGSGGGNLNNFQVYGACGGYAAGWVDVTPGDIIPVTIGAGGLVGLQPTAGGTSSFGSYMSATGGQLYNPPGTSADLSGTAQQNFYDFTDYVYYLATGGRGINGQINLRGESIPGIGAFGRANSSWWEHGNTPGAGGVANGVSGRAGAAGLVRIYY